MTRLVLEIAARFATALGVIAAVTWAVCAALAHHDREQIARCHAAGGQWTSLGQTCVAVIDLHDAGPRP